MRGRTMLAIAGTIAATAALISVASAGTPHARSHKVGAGAKVDLSTQHGAYKYLRAHGYNPRHFVIQRGKRNYAGPRCPGKRWSCTRATRVLQVGNQNTFECTGYPTPGENCVIEQPTGGQNTARCIEHDTLAVTVQTCDITQTGTSNDAYVDQLNDSNQGSPQTVTQNTTIKQSGGDNQAVVHQKTKQSTSDSTTASGTITQDQNAYLTTVICQGGPGNPCTTTNSPDGVNTATVDQSRWANAHASGGAITQNQDVALNQADCYLVGEPTSPNTCASITQNSLVRNDSKLDQDIHLLEHASGTTGSVTQKQTPPLPATAGTDGHVERPTSSLPQNTSDVHQHITYDMSGPDGAAQDQDPGHAGCCSSGGGNGKSKFNLHQVITEHASERDAPQGASTDGVIGSSPDFLTPTAAPSASDGSSCMILQAVKINSDNLTTRDTGTTDCEAFIECNSTTIYGPPCTGGPAKGKQPTDSELLALGFDASDFQNAFNFVYPVSLSGIG
jgi:hypothetical protein